MSSRAHLLPTPATAGADPRRRAAAAGSSAPADGPCRSRSGSRAGFAVATLAAVACSAAWLAAAWAAAGNPPASLPALLTASVLSATWLTAEALAQFRFCDPTIRRGGGSPLDVLQGLVLLAAVTACVASPPLPLPPAGLGLALTAGTFLTVAGVGVRYAAIARLGSRFHDDVAPSPGQTLVTDGVYRFLRHPSEVGSLAAATGIGLATANPLSVTITAAALAPLSALRCRRENAALTSISSQPPCPAAAPPDALPK